VKLKNLFQLLGFRGKHRHYPYEVLDYDLGNGDVVHFAQWKHPVESVKKITADLVTGYRRYIRNGDFCLDIGAHSGDTTLPMAVAAGKDGCVLALEPNPFVFHVLEKNARANTHLTNIQTMMAAAASDEGFMEFQYSDSGFCNGGCYEGMSVFSHGHAYKQEVFSVNLEKELRSDYSHLLHRLSFIKIDTEGYDLYVIKTIEGILREFRPVVKTEVFKKTNSQYRFDLLSLFQKLGYTVYKIKAEPLVTDVELTSDNLNPGSHYDILAVPDKAERRYTEKDV
jgi:FkbM family methyltransferase